MSHRVFAELKVQNNLFKKSKIIFRTTNPLRPNLLKENKYKEDCKFNNFCKDADFLLARTLNYDRFTVAISIENKCIMRSFSRACCKGCSICYYCRFSTNALIILAWTPIRTTGLFTGFYYCFLINSNFII